MRFRFHMIPPALIAASAPALGAYYMTLDEAQNVMLPGAVLTERFVTLTEGQAKVIATQANAPVPAYKVKAWQAEDGSWFILDQVQGKDDTITYAATLTREGKLKSIEILECVPDYGAIRMPEWRAQFVGQVAGEKRYIDNIAGSTLSSQHITEGVRRILATYALVLKPQNM